MLLPISFRNMYVYKQDMAMKSVKSYILRMEFIIFNFKIHVYVYICKLDICTRKYLKVM